MSLLSPKSGTPVKLLGREDASMDWYNLETSKRVKAFRCGEYDECIEKAKVYATRANRKGVKYARREEAILQALELEHARYGHQEYHSRVNHATGTKYDGLARELHKLSGSSNEHRFMAGKFKGNSTQESSQSVSLSEQPNPASTTEVHHMEKKIRTTPNDSEDDSSEGTKRMKGLQDLGLRVASKRKTKMQFPSEGSLQLVLPDCASLTESNICNLSTHSPVNSNKGSCSSLKRRCYQVAHFHENFKRKDRRRPLTKVMESTAKVAIPGFCNWGASPGKSSLEGVVEVKVESTVPKKASFSMVINNHSDSTGTSCEKEASFDASELTCNAAVGVSNSISHQEEKDNTFSSVLESPDDDCSNAFLNVPSVREENGTGGFSTSGSKKLQSDTVGKHSKHINIPLNNEELDETGSTSFASHLSHADQSMEKHTSKWQLKRKWHSEHASKGSCKSPDSRVSDQSEHMDGSFGVFSSKVDSSFESLASDNCSQLVKHGQVSDDPGESLQQRNQVSGQSPIVGSSTLALKSSRRPEIGSGEVVIQSETRKIACESLRHEKPAIVKSTNKARLMESSFKRGMRSPMLPQSSLSHCRSSLTACSFSRIRDTLLYDVKLDVQASYHGHHVPLVSLMSRLNGKAIIGRPVTVEVLEDGYGDCLTGGGINSGRVSSNYNLYDVQIENAPEQQKGTIDGPLLVDGSDKMTGALQKQSGYADMPILEARRNTSKRLTGRSPSSRKKLPKKNKKCGFLSKKTRKLSSFTVDCELKREERKPVVEKLGGPVIACVPLKLVFSRINEGLSGFTRPTNRILTSEKT